MSGTGDMQPLRRDLPLEEPENTTGEPPYGRERRTRPDLLREAVWLFDNYPGEMATGAEDAAWTKRHADWTDKAQAALAGQPQRSYSAAKETAIWSEDENCEMWECSECKTAWTFPADGPEENGMKYCPVCGRRIVEFIRYPESSPVDSPTQSSIPDGGKP